ncbi:hypothetical protein CPB86DRAFT_308721 [Serendipita vermifera]|nr:hypothetical protein CPB86DRAFT_308721 [Serendipita vermifera]
MKPVEVGPVCNLITQDECSYNQHLHLHDEIMLESPKDARSKRAIHALTVCAREILSWLPFRDTITFFQLSRATRLWKETIIRLMVHKLLHLYVSKPEDLLALMRKIGAVVAGSSALWFAVGMPNDRKANDLDIYTPRCLYEEIVDFLYEEGYTTSREIGSEQYRETLPFSSVRRLVKEGKHIDVLESFDYTSVSPIIRSHSTATMNFITADSFVVLYPALTFIRHSVITWLQTNTIGDREWKEKYEDRSFDVFPIEYLSKQAKAWCFRYKKRNIGDQKCLWFSFGSFNDDIRRKEYKARWVVSFRDDQIKEK